MWTFLPNLGSGSLLAIIRGLWQQLQRVSVISVGELASGLHSVVLVQDLAPVTLRQESTLCRGWWSGSSKNKFPEWRLTSRTQTRLRTTDLKHDWEICCCSVTKSCPTLCNYSKQGFPVLHYFWVWSNSCSLGQWYLPTISSSAAPCSSCPQSFPASGPFPMSQLFASGDQNHLQLQHQSFQWIFRVDFL